MQEKIQQHIKTPLGMSVVGITFILIGVLVYTNLKETTQAEQVTHENSESIEIAIINTSATSSGLIESSWPGEILSQGNLEIQPERGGTLSQWRVHIGEAVRAGQVLGILSRPPLTPELVSMLAGEAEGLAKARSNADAEVTYVAERIAQLLSQRESIERSSTKTGELLDAVQTTAASSLIAVKKKSVRSVLENAIATTYPYISGNSTIPTTYQSVVLRSPIGAQNSQLRDGYPGVLYAAHTDLKNDTFVPENSGLAYFDHTIKLANASLPDGSTLTESDLAMLKESLVSGRKDFIEALDALRTSELESVNTRQEYSTEIKEIDAQVSELRKTLAIAKGEVVAKEAAYNTVHNTINGGNVIVSPRSGIVSTILKKPGEFVSPGMPVAIITSEGKNEKTIRFSVPVIAQKPTIGTLLRVVRPGFPSDMQTARLVGIGSAVDTMGVYMADAVFIETSEWPVGGSVRVLLNGNSKTVTILLSSITWDENGMPFVFGVSSADRLYAKKLKLGRTLGATIEVYEGLVNGDRYVVSPTTQMHEDMLLSELMPKHDEHADSKSESMDGMNMEGMDMHSHE